jgi:hypothetical protein
MTSNAITWVDTVTKLDERHAGAVIVAGSHGGGYAAYCAARAQVRAAIFNDAGVGKDSEGIHALSYFDALGVPAATTSHLSAHIGDGKDSFENGVISHVNETARALGCRASQHTRECAGLMMAAPAFNYPVPAKEESRTVIADAAGRAEVVVIDSLALLLPRDANSVMVAGSHGAVLPMDDRILLAGDALGALFCDAGFGKDDIAVSRIKKLDLHGKPGAAVSVHTARIGNGMSVLTEGILSFVNETAARYGARAGMTAREYVSLLQDTLASKTARAPVRASEP